MHKEMGRILISLLNLRGKHVSTKFPLGFEGRTIFHLEPKQNFKDVQRWYPVSASLLKAGVRLAGSEGGMHVLHRRAVCGAGRFSGWPGGGVHLVSFLPHWWLKGSLSDTTPSFCCP